MNEKLDLEDMPTWGFLVASGVLFILTLGVVALQFSAFAIFHDNLVGLFVAESLGVGALCLLDWALHRNDRRVKNRREQRSRLVASIRRNLVHGDETFRKQALQALLGLLYAYPERGRARFQEGLRLPLESQGGPSAPELPSFQSIPSPAPLVSEADRLNALLGQVEALNSAEERRRTQALQMFIDVVGHIDHEGRFALLLAIEHAGVGTQEALTAASELFSAIPAQTVDQLAGQLWMRDQPFPSPLLFFLENEKGSMDIARWRTFYEEYREIQEGTNHAIID